ncbi:unnamed protein product [Schistosoma curassoni]|uniref:BZIP domain-containing protein n=1 Tax=Schistosoma curassoni TaxID=6186 RepID=A0A183L6W1_9TREM|nr:unnamed protein product [Schistosoma curassoni]
MEFVDEADRYNQELDNNNRQLMRKISEDQQKIQRVNSIQNILRKKAVSEVVTIRLRFRFLTMTNAMTQM